MSHQSELKENNWNMSSGRTLQEYARPFSRAIPLEKYSHKFTTKLEFSILMPLNSSENGEEIEGVGVLQFWVKKERGQVPKPEATGV